MSEITPEKVHKMLAFAKPGPWYGQEGHPDPVAYIRRKHPQWRGNAALIAAAPDIAQAYLDAMAELEALRR